MKLVKAIVHWVTGKCEIERVLEDESRTSLSMTSKFASSIFDSTKMKNVKTIVFSSNGQGETFDVACVTTMIADYKSLKRRGLAIERAPRCLKDMQTCNQQIAALNRLRIEVFDPQHHALLLERLWRGLKGRKAKRSGSEDWTEIGFQGKKPETDLRGMGILGLACLVYFVENSKTASLRLYRDYPELSFAITGINVVAFTFQALEQRQLDPAFYENDPNGDISKRALETFANKFGEFFVSFVENHWRPSSRDIMSFQQVFSSFKKAQHLHIKRTVF